MIESRLKKARTPRFYLLTITGLILLLLAFFSLGNYPNFIQNYYTQGLYRLISPVLHIALGWLPVSVGDVFYITVIISLIRSLVIMIKLCIKKQFKLMGLRALRLVIRIEIFVVAFYLFWGMNYFAPPAAQVLNLQDTTYTLAELKTITSLLIDSANARRNLVTPYQTRNSNSAIYQTSVQAIKQIALLNPALKSHFPAAKPALFTPLINYFGVSGYFTPFTGEAQVNYSMPWVEKPVTACHEMAHQMGFAREDEANFVAFLTGLRSPDTLLRYSAYYMAMDQFMRNVYRRDSVAFKHLKLRISPAVKHDLKTERDYWMGYQNQISDVSALFYDNFLKLNNQPQGLRTYNRMIILTMAWYRKEGVLSGQSLVGSQ